MILQVTDPQKKLRFAFQERLVEWVHIAYETNQKLDISGLVERTLERKRR